MLFCSIEAPFVKFPYQTKCEVFSIEIRWQLIAIKMTTKAYSQMCVKSSHFTLIQNIFTSSFCDGNVKMNQSIEIGKKIQKYRKSMIRITRQFSHRSVYNSWYFGLISLAIPSTIKSVVSYSSGRKF